MSTLGFRAEKDAVNWAVVSKQDEILLLVSYGRIDAGVNESASESLAHFRKEILLLVAQFKPDVAYVRLPETYNRRAQSPKNAASMDARSRVEGVILEACQTAGVKTLSGMLNAISNRMGSDTAKAYLSADSLRGIQWPKKDPACRESILAAVAGIEG